MARVISRINKLTATDGTFRFTNIGSTIDVGTKLATVTTDQTAVSAAITAALVAANATHDSTPEITTVQSAVTTQAADLALAVTGMNADVVVSINTANITTVTQLRRALDAVAHQFAGGLGGLTP